MCLFIVVLLLCFRCVRCACLVLWLCMFFKHCFIGFSVGCLACLCCSCLVVILWF